MKNKEIIKLKKQYPTDQYNVRESQGSVIVSPKKSVVRMFKYQAEKLLEFDDPTKKLEELLAKTKLKKEDFAQQQVTITKVLNDKLLQQAAACKTRRIIFLQRLMGEE